MAVANGGRLMARRVLFVASLIALLCAGLTPSSASTIVWARSSDALTLDPHAVNEGPTHTLNHQIYEPLLIRDTRGRLLPALASRWRVSADPRVWRFELRRGVTFHDGSPLTAGDVVFSLNRARHPYSDMKGRLGGIAEIRETDARTIEIVTKGRDPILPLQLTDIFIMSKAWAQKHGVTVPQNFRAGQVTYAATHANGTGPFMLVDRVPGTRTHLKRNPQYWEPLPAITEVTYVTMPSKQARFDALVAGQVDFVQDVPVDRILALSRNANITLKQGSENRVIFLGLNVTPSMRSAAQPNTPNPMADRRVRNAIDVTIDRRKIQRDVMMGQSIPTGVVAPPAINGYPQRLDRIPEPNLKQARTFLAQANVADGFTVNLDCPSDRYVNAPEICHAIAAQLKPLGILVTPRPRTKSEHFALIRSMRSDMYLLGWGVPTFDSEYIFRHLFHSAVKGQPSWNGTGFANRAIDAQIDSLANDMDLGKRNQTVAEIWWRVHFERIYIPLHVQTLVYAMRKGLEIDVDISDNPKLKYARITRPATPADPN
jgi:peptide/nickel transport system substrate-binding protein